jgi:hypothetical protein
MRHVLAMSLVLSSTPAFADYTEVAPVRPLTLSDPAGLSSISLEFQLTRWTQPQIPPLPDLDFQNLTFDLAADITLAKHWQLLARMPLTKTGIDDTDCCDFAVGNLTLGGRGLWSSVGTIGRTVAGAEFSLSLPTASDEDEGLVSASSAALARLPHDPGRYLPNTTTLRFMPLLQYYTPRFLIQGEAGLQLFLYDNDGGDGSDTAVRLAFAVGVRATYTVAILAEINSLFILDDTAGDDDVSSLDLGVRYASGKGLFGARIYLPIDGTLRDLDMFGIGLDGGLRF